jgi:RND superfamily putative drug exporter
MLERLARFVISHHRIVLGAWLALIVFGVFSTTRVANRWLEQFSIPGYSAYEANQRVLRTFGSGAQAPDVAVFHSDRDVTSATSLKSALARFERRHPNVRVSSYWSTRSRAYVSRDRHTMFAEFYPPGQNGFSATDDLGLVRSAMRGSVPAGVTVHVTGVNALYDSEGSGASGGPSVLTETLIGGLGSSSCCSSSGRCPRSRYHSRSPHRRS